MRAAVTFAIVAWASGAHAAPPRRPQVNLTVDPCVGLDAGAVRRAAALELRATLAETGGADVTRVLVACAQSSIAITVADPVTGKTLFRAIDLGAEPRDVHERLLGLAVAETVAASWIELAAEPPPRVRSTTAVASPAARQAAAATARRHLGRSASPARTTMAVASLGRHLAFDPPLIGGCLLWALRLDDRWSVALDVAAEHSDVPVPLGQVDTLLLSAAPKVLLSHPAGPLRLGVGAGARGGLARLAGVPRAAGGVRAGTVSGPWGGPILVAEAWLRPRSWLAVGVGAEAGLAVLTVTARAGDAAVDIDGTWGAAWLALGIAQ